MNPRQAAAKMRRMRVARKDMMLKAAQVTIDETFDFAVWLTSMPISLATSRRLGYLYAKRHGPEGKKDWMPFKTPGAINVQSGRLRQDWRKVCGYHNGEIYGCVSNDNRVVKFLKAGKDPESATKMVYRPTQEIAEAYLAQVANQRIKSAFRAWKRRYG